MLDWHSLWALQRSPHATPHHTSYGSSWTETEVAQSCPTLCDPVDYSPQGSSIHGILQARLLGWAAISFSRGSSQPRDRTRISRIAGSGFNLWGTRDWGWWQWAVCRNCAPHIATWAWAAQLCPPGQNSAPFPMARKCSLLGKSLASRAEAAPLHDLISE